VNELFVSVVLAAPLVVPVLALASLLIPARMRSAALGVPGLALLIGLIGSSTLWRMAHRFQRLHDAGHDVDYVFATGPTAREAAIAAAVTTVFTLLAGAVLLRNFHRRSFKS
jgi:hypothetical protein